MMKIIIKKTKNVKDRVGAELEVNTDLVMLCHTTITSTSSTLKNLYIGKITIHPIQPIITMITKKQRTDYSVHTLHHK